MAVIAPTPIDAGPAVPSSADSEVTFDAAYEAFNAWEKNQLQPQANALAANVYGNAQEAVTAANTAIAEADAALGYRNTANSAATTATNAASTATTKADEAAASAVQASKLNLGAKSSAPTVDNQGAALLTGATYFDTTLGKWRAWNGAAWVDPVSVTAGVTSLNGASGALTRTTLAAYGITDAVATHGDQTIAGNKSFSGNLLATGGALGYGVGAGGTVVQATSKSTEVTLNKPSGQITMHNASLAAGATARFILNSTYIAASDEISAWISDAVGNASSHIVWVDGVAAGLCAICVKNINTVSLPLAIKIGFAVRKGATS